MSTRKIVKFMREKLNLPVTGLNIMWMDETPSDDDQIKIMKKEMKDIGISDGAIKNSDIETGYTTKAYTNFDEGRLIKSDLMPDFRDDVERGGLISYTFGARKDNVIADGYYPSEADLEKFYSDASKDPSILTKPVGSRPYLFIRSIIDPALKVVKVTAKTPVGQAAMANGTLQKSSQIGLPKPTIFNVPGPTLSPVQQSQAFQKLQMLQHK